MLFSSSSSSSSSSEFAPPSSPAVMMVVSSLRSLKARSRQRRFPARDDRAPPAENDKHQMFLFPIARIHRVFPRVRHFRRGVRVRRVRALLLGSYSSRERGRQSESAQSRDAGHNLYSMCDLRAQTMTRKKKEVDSLDGRFFPIERDRHFSRRRRPRTMLTTRPTTTQTTQTTLSKGGRRRRRLRRSVARRRAMMRSSVDDSRFDEASSSSSFTSSEASKGVHVVSPGDSLYGVAVHYGVDPRDLIVRRRRRPFFSSSNTTNQSSLLSATLTSGRERVFSLHFEFKTMERDDFDETLRGRN